MADRNKLRIKQADRIASRSRYKDKKDRKVPKKVKSKVKIKPIGFPPKGAKISIDF